MSSSILNAPQTAQALPYLALSREIEALLQDPTVAVPPRIVQALQGGGSLFVMPATDARVAITKLISFIPTNAQRGLPTIQGDIVVFDVQTGQRIALLDGPTVTARRTAAVSLLAAQKLAPRRDGPLLIVGAGVQGRAHLEAFHEGLGVQEQQAMLSVAAQLGVTRERSVAAAWRAIACQRRREWRLWPELYEGFWHPQRVRGTVKVSGQTRPRRDLRQAVSDLHAQMATAASPASPTPTAASC